MFAVDGRELRVRFVERGRVEKAAKSGDCKILPAFGQSQSRVSKFLFQPIETHQREQAIKSRKMRAPWAPDIRFPRLSGDTAVSVLLAVQLAK